jgi:hypothetical protein
MSVKLVSFSELLIDACRIFYTRVYVVSLDSSATMFLLLSN